MTPPNARVAAARDRRWVPVVGLARARVVWTAALREAFIEAYYRGGLSLLCACAETGVPFSSALAATEGPTPEQPGLVAGLAEAKRAVEEEVKGVLAAHARDPEETNPAWAIYWAKTQIAGFQERQAPVPVTVTLELGDSLVGKLGPRPIGAGTTEGGV